MTTTTTMTIQPPSPQPSEEEQFKGQEVRVQLLIAVLKGILAGDLKLCDSEEHHQEDRHSLAGWIQVHHLQEQGWHYDIEFNNIYKTGSPKHNPTLYPFDTMKCVVTAIGLNRTESRLLFQTNTTMHEKLCMALLLEKGFRFYSHIPSTYFSAVEHPSSYMYFTYDGVNERYDYAVGRRNQYFTLLYNRFFGPEEL
jgi:hypothetical protein